MNSKLLSILLLFFIGSVMNIKVSSFSKLRSVDPNCGCIQRPTICLPSPPEICPPSPPKICIPSPPEICLPRPPKICLPSIPKFCNCEKECGCDTYKKGI